jgi:predicted DNA binding CopG/RHH family protein
MLKSKRSNRKRPLPEERIELVVPAELKTKARERARKEKLPLQVFIRLALEKYMLDHQKPSVT